MRKAFILAITTQALILFQRLVYSDNNWTLDKRKECSELINIVSSLKDELASIVGREEANKLVKNAYENVFSRDRKTRCTV